jgi:superfamily II DNA/RNA helicase
VKFSELGVAPDLVSTLAEDGIEDAFPIQEQTIPLALKGQDIIGQAKTGTGKTLGFGLPLLQRLGENPEPGVQALVVAPTRELAMQVFEDLDRAAAQRGTVVVPIYGGKAYEGQIDQIKDGAQVIVATPGRLIDLMNQRIISLKNVHEIVLDEADKMLDLGFLPDIEKIFAAVPQVRHTMLFSATMPGPILNLARRFMTQPVHIRVTDPEEGVLQKNIRHIVYRAHPLDKDELIARILQASGRGKTVIFMRTKRAAAKLLEELRDRGFSAAAVHGDMNQEQRERSMAAFKGDKKDVLIATDVAARGIDVDDVTHVINHTIPEDEKTYLHRVGRTGRAGNSGIAVTFVDWDDLHRWSLISKALELGEDDPRETYSSSPHLFEELDIPEGTKGRLPGASTRGNDTPPKEASRSRSRSRSRKRTTDGAAKGAPGEGTSAEGATTEGGEPSRAPRRRRRRRRGGGSGEGSASAETSAE